MMVLRSAMACAMVLSTAHGFMPAAGPLPAARQAATTSRISPLAGRPRAAPALRMSGAQGKDEIDFSKVGFGDGTQLSGMVFRPEETATEPESRCRVDWDVRCEKALNDHINVEYTASYAYHSLFAYFDRDTVALKGFAKFFADQSVEEREHAQQFMEYQNTRGGQVVLKPVAVPEMQFSRVDGTSDALYAMELALQLEKFVYRKLKGLHELGTECDDPQFTDHIEKYLGEQVEAIKEMAEKVAQIRRVGTGHGVWHMDQELIGA
mmetsp:Transcript_9688/g.24001  ORF Transcript_9688/g.24001 Transcript_9688/m.24001 type:complete len:265 (-) Transcript_9688:600-1394(-)|eukprot:CAMPEP_0206245332 /NCGR_PEP_ID=MMETSP0047_2-20121206/18639_1 /ASSEMBLY_ACC=CAM_ASM_000192 /TAXON_ID=195065 /ORGANISM="Chroomonas mesostigmatica_cf, Strain CCMP1168" /LENGTH=264 /DNA_ID=CAMNT_0053670621 /DNA_START=37 /DNA_END=831 /DNA_ORIENTATION=-